MISTLDETSMGLPEAVRARIVSLLNQQLADAIDLRSRAKQAHWNVHGPRYVSVFLVSDLIVRETDESIDAMAERISRMGGVVMGLTRSVAAASRLPSYPRPLLTDGDDYIEALGHALAPFVVSALKTAEAAVADCDCETAQLLTDIARISSKLLWLVQSYLHRLGPKMDAVGFVIGASNFEDLAGNLTERCGDCVEYPGRIGVME